MMPAILDDFSTPRPDKQLSRKWLAPLRCYSNFCVWRVTRGSPELIPRGSPELIPSNIQNHPPETTVKGIKRWGWNWWNHIVGTCWDHEAIPKNASRGDFLREDGTARSWCYVGLVRVDSKPWFWGRTRENLLSILRPAEVFNHMFF